MFLSGLIEVVELMPMSKKSKLPLEITSFIFSLSSVFSHNASKQIVLFSCSFQLENQNFEGIHTDPELIAESQTTCSRV